MKYRIKEVQIEEEVYFYPQQKESWLDSWIGMGYVKFLTLEEAQRAIDQEIERRKKLEQIRNPPIKYHYYNKTQQ